MIPEGTFKARATEGALGWTSKGKEQIAVSFVLLEGDAEGSQITWYGYFSDKTQDRTIESLRVCGWQGDDLSDLTGIDANEVWLVIEHEENDQGEVRARVRWVNGGGGVQMKEPMAADQAKAFAARMKGAVMAQRSKSGGGAAAAAPPRTPHSGGGSARRPAPARVAGPTNPANAVTPPDDDTIPF